MNDIQQHYFLDFLLLFLSAIFLFKFIFNKLTKPKASNLKLPPSPPMIPFIGHLYLLGPFFHESLQNLSAKYGPIFNLRLGISRWCMVVQSASAAKEIFKTHDLSFAQHPNLAFADETPYGESGFFSAPYGDYWKFVKKVYVNELFSTRQLERSRALREEEVDWFLHKVFESAKKKDLTNNIVCRMAMSTRCSEKNDDAERIRELVKETFEVGSKLFIGDVLGPLKRLAFWLYGSQVLDVTLRFDELLEKILKKHEDQIRKGENEDLMDVLLKVYSDDRAEFKMTRTHLKALLSEPHEAIVRTLAELINHPNIFRKLREEIKSVVGGSRLVQESDVVNLPYLQAVVKETLRLYPPLPVTTRECRQACKIEGFDVPQNTMVAINLYAIMRDPELWDNPNEFWPERLLAFSKEHDQDGSVGENSKFLTFGGGRRACPGAKIGLIMMHTAVAAMVQCDWKVEGDHENKVKVNMEVGKGVFMHLAHPLKCLPVICFNPFASSINI
ncbi:hypothetical protein I3842_Q025000 [Carya illinoinensis]|uniref:Cytochrome P450 n=1 Tax=Carya illinoinensis TaxID=32201 RepID=A0A922D3C0_CARIL|nr:hypothetical protein I3842_Q025000 [Carya illinoinensis]